MNAIDVTRGFIKNVFALEIQIGKQLEQKCRHIGSVKVAGWTRIICQWLVILLSQKVLRVRIFNGRAPPMLVAFPVFFDIVFCAITRAEVFAIFQYSWVAVADI